MSRCVPVREVAHARAGDKGDISNVSVWVFEPKHYDDLLTQLTAERIKTAFPRLLRGAVVRYEMPALHGFNFVLHNAIEGGVNYSLNLDAHGKSWSFLILGLDLRVTY